ncbi:uncharacterized protein LOC131664885 isoform X2 [Phymastichus coffea]|uniref:uncharacterized protein LOC131664885 isoform X2 n=1 Tax=Phymastichus coffea TaxID=108790 RepID=UPI00273C2073|nr:uncharacterized protein LOC131664885 isoform X2 [Phymastichus coffea]
MAIMDDRQLPEDLLEFNLEDLLNLTLDLDSLNSIEKISPQWLDELASSITIDNNELSTRNVTQKDRTADTYTETVEVNDQRNSERIDLEKSHNSDQPLNHVEIIVLGDTVQDNAPLSSPIIDQQTENITSDSLWMQNSDLITKTTEPRICLSKSELSILEREFQICHYPDRFTRKKLALTLNLSRLTVSEWFTNRRIKMRKQSSGNFSSSNENTEENGLRDTTVKNWFHNRRVKMRKLMDHAQSVEQSLQIQSNTFSALETSLDIKSDVNNNELISNENVFKNQQSQCDTVRQLTPTFTLTDEQMEKPQAGSSVLLPSTVSNQGLEQNTLKTLVQLVQSSTYNNQENQESQIEISSLSPLPKSNQSLNKKTPEKLEELLPSQTEACSQIENSFSLSSRPSNRRRKRTNFCKSQLSILERQFMKCKYPDFETICQLASTINVDDNKVRIWFKNRRSKQKDLEKNGQLTESQTETIKFRPPSSTSIQKCKRTNNRKSRLHVLEREFKKCQYPNLFKVFQLASKTNFTNSQVRRWFIHRRAKQKLLEKRGQKVVQVQKKMPELSLLTESFEQNCRPKGTTLNASQLAVLEREFSTCHYPESYTREKLALAMNLTFSQVSKWFENRRTKERKLRSYSQPSSVSTETCGLSQETDFNENQLAILEDEFKRCQYPDDDSLIYIASIVNMPYTKIIEWFTNRRAREKTSEMSLLTGTSRQQFCARKIQFNKSQLAVLEHAFARYQYLDYDTTCSLSAIINVSYERVRTWFTNRRAKLRKVNKHGQFSQPQIGTTNFPASTEYCQMDAPFHEKQIQPFQNYQQPPMVRSDYCNNTLYNNVQQMRVFPQNLRFGWYNSVSPVFIPQSYNVTAFPPIQEDAFYINPAPPSAQYVYSHPYDAPVPNHSFLAEL